MGKMCFDILELGLFFLQEETAPPQKKPQTTNPQTSNNKTVNEVHSDKYVLIKNVKKDLSQSVYK